MAAPRKGLSGTRKAAEVWRTVQGLGEAKAMAETTRTSLVARALVALVSGLLVALLLLSSGVGAQPPLQPPMGPFGPGGSPWGGRTAIDWITVLALIAAAVFFILWLVERRKGSAPGASATPLEVLKGRYARGEINRQEFEEKRRDLL